MTPDVLRVNHTLNQPADLKSLFLLAQAFFDALCLNLTRYNIVVPDGLTLKQADGMLPYYNFEDGHIYVATPDASSPTGKVVKIFMRSLLVCDSEQELTTLFEVFIPYMIGHEMGHALRDYYGFYDAENPWQEEQIANQFAAAVIQRHLTLTQKAECRRLIYRAMQNMGVALDDATAPGSSHHSLLYALHAEGEITDQALDNIQIVEKLFAAQPEDILLNISTMANLLTERLNQREEVVHTFNNKTADNVSKYIYYLLGWLYYNLTSSQDIYLDEFARMYLGQVTRTLPPIEIKSEPTIEEIRACYQASLLAKPFSQIGYRYYYKRYRALVLNKARRQESDIRPRFDEEMMDFFEGWEDDDTDTIDYLARFVSPEIRAVLPANLGVAINWDFDPAPSLPAESDRRLWNHIIHNEPDEAAAETLRRLERLEHMSIFNTLPTEILLTLAENFYRIKLDIGEALIREGDTDRNVYILLEGSVDVYVTNASGKLQHLHKAGSGAIFGEMAFFTNQPRSASVIASSPATCYILKASDLRFLLYKYPIIAIGIGTALAQKLQETTTMIQEFNFFIQTKDL